MEQALIRPEEVENRILRIRGREVMIDADVAELFQVKTGEMNRRLKNNPEKFPSETYVFELSAEEKQQIVQDVPRLERLKFSPVNPKAFTEYGIIMMSTVLNSPTAIALCHVVVDTFVRFRRQNLLIQELRTEIQRLRDGFSSKFEELALEIDKLNHDFRTQVAEYDSHLQVVFEEIMKFREQLEPSERNIPPIGFVPGTNWQASSPEEE